MPLAVDAITRIIYHHIRQCALPIRTWAHCGMTPFNPLFIFSVLNLSLAALGQQISLVTPPSVVQCADVPIQWSGGIGPFSLTIATTDNASLNSVEVIPVGRSSPYTWSEDLPAGTPFTISLTDSNGNSAMTPALTVQDSTNTSCLQSGSVPPPASSHSHSSKPLSTIIQTSTGTSIGSSDTGSPTPSSSHGSSSRAVIQKCQSSPVLSPGSWCFCPLLRYS
ncbi:hypothetical protein JB92DRAFT_259503 [Gautieria morchelliformis]|nr:hypothetical protein JB92DRAFT_259503 [Gautieria morchelliformis]